MMKRNDYEAIAQALNDEGASARCCDAIAEVLQLHNRNFDRARFHKAACIYEEPDWGALDKFTTRDCSLAEVLFSPFIR